MPTLTPHQLQILQHALGLDQYGQGPPTIRNHFCAGGDDVPDCAELVALGLMRTFRHSFLPYFNCTVTDLGVIAVQEQSPKPPKLTRSQQRYLAYLKANTGFSFGEWLTRK